MVTPVAEPMISPLVRVFELGIYSMHEMKPAR
jgi:hypothetical protein